MSGYNQKDYERFVSKLRRGLTIRTRPELSTRNLDGLLWFNHTFQKDWWNLKDPWFKKMVEEHTLMGSSPLEVLHPQVLNDISTASDYLQQLIEYNLARGELSLKVSDFTIREVSFPHPLPKRRVMALKDFPRGKFGKPREPRLTRKRANGLWWIYGIARLMEEHVDLSIGSEIYSTHETTAGEDGWFHGREVVAGIAGYHESRFPTASRNVS